MIDGGGRGWEVDVPVARLMTRRDGIRRDLSRCFGAKAQKEYAEAAKYHGIDHRPRRLSLEEDVQCSSRYGGVFLPWSCSNPILPSQYSHDFEGSDILDLETGQIVEGNGET